MPPGVRRQFRNGGGGHQAQVGGRDDARARHPGRVGEDRELFQVRDLAKVHLLGELAAHRRGEIFALAEPAAR